MRPVPARPWIARSSPERQLGSITAGVAVHGGSTTVTSAKSSVMVQHDRQPAAQRETTPSRPVVQKAWAAARGRYEGSLAQAFVMQLKAIDFTDQVMLFGAGLLVSLLPFLILLAAFASNRIDDDIALRLGLDRRASGIVTHLLTSAPASLNVATVTSLLFVAAGTLAVASALQQILRRSSTEITGGACGGCTGC